MIIFLILYTMIEFLNIFLSYKVLLRVRFRKQKWIYIILLFVVICLQILVFYLTDDTWRNIVVAAAGLCFPLFLADNRQRRLKLVLWYPILYIGTSLINTLFSYLLAFIMKTDQNVISESHLLNLLSNSCTVFIMLFILFVINKYRNSNGDSNKSLDYKHFIVLISGLLCAAFTLGFCQYIEHGNEVEASDIVIVSITLCIATLLFIFLCIWQQITMKKEQKYRTKTEEYKRYILQQEERIHMMIEQDEKIRRFRHDFQAYVVALEILVQEDNKEEAKKYIENMKKESAHYDIKKYTGITAVDAVINNLVNKAEKQNIIVNWEGNISEWGKIELFDLCTVFSNLLKNAIEACEKMPESKRNIKINCYCYEQNLFLLIRNEYLCKVGDVPNFKTDKDDLTNHGFGIKNARETIEKYGGKLTYTINDGWVIAEVIF